MPRVYTNTDCPLHGSTYCARLNMESCGTCTVRGRDGEEMELLRKDLDAIEALVPEEGIFDLFATQECVLCKGEEKGRRAWYALTDIGNAEPRRKQAKGIFGIRREARAGSVLPIQLACCDACRKRYLKLQYITPVMTAAGMLAGLGLMSIRPLREALMAIAQVLPMAAFLALSAGSAAAGMLLRKRYIARYRKEMYLSVFKIGTLRKLRRLGWFELYETRDVTRLVFSKKRIRQGLYTGMYAPKEAGEEEIGEEQGQNA